MEGHAQNISAVAFHPELPIIMTGSEDGQYTYTDRPTLVTDYSYCRFPIKHKNITSTKNCKKHTSKISNHFLLFIFLTYLKYVKLRLKFSIHYEIFSRFDAKKIVLA